MISDRAVSRLDECLAASACALRHSLSQSLSFIFNRRSECVCMSGWGWEKWERQWGKEGVCMCDRERVRDSLQLFRYVWCNAGQCNHEKFNWFKFDVIRRNTFRSITHTNTHTHTHMCDYYHVKAIIFIRLLLCMSSFIATAIPRNIPHLIQLVLQMFNMTL